MRLMTMLKQGAAAAAVAGTMALAGQAWAGEQYVDGTGFAVSGYDPVAYFELEQAPVGQSQPTAVPGRADITTEWNGATWAFASEANRDRFLADPERYAPAYDGHCAYGLAQGGKVPGNPHLWRIVDDRLYLNITDQVVEFWEADIPGYIEDADGNWTDMEVDPASSNPVPALDTSVAPSAG